MFGNNWTTLGFCADSRQRRECDFLEPWMDGHRRRERHVVADG
jgi:hypothetical protein